MATAIVTGSCGLVGSAVTELLIEEGMTVHGIDNDTRGDIFGPGGSTWAVRSHLVEKYGGKQYFHEDFDVRDEKAMHSVFHTSSDEIKLVVHTAGQPSHDWSAQAPLVDFDINARATLLLLQCVRNWCPRAVFVYLSTNKVYGDWINSIAALRESATRYTWPMGVRYSGVSFNGVNEKAPIDRSMHSLFGVSKLAADLMVQEYGRYFGIPTVCFRCGCVTGESHQGVKLHGFLSYLAHCIKDGKPYTVFGYKGKQVRDNIHAIDLARAIYWFYRNPRVAAVYNMGGGYHNSCSVLEAIDALQDAAGRKLDYIISDRARKGDHKWWITDTSEFELDYPGWGITIGLFDMYEGLIGG